MTSIDPPMNNDLPPEAFTKETLQEAFNWLQEQPEPLRSSIQTPERLVSLFRKSQRLHDADAPVSSKKFVDDLKTLANSLDQFNQPTINLNPQPAPPPAVVPPTVERFEHQAPPAQPQVTMAQPPPQPQPQQATFTQSVKQTQKAKIEFTTETQNITAQGIEIDDVTIERVKKVRERFNLGSDNEALRLLVSIGFEKFNQFP